MPLSSSFFTINLSEIILLSSFVSLGIANVLPSSSEHFLTFF